MTKQYAESVSSLAALIDFVKTHLSTFDTVLFRGQRKDWPLLPKLARLNPRHDSGILNVERKMLEGFKVRALWFINRDLKTDWEWLAMAQHHGMATRLLDWTTNPLSALWFTVEKPAKDSEDGVLWVFTPAEEDHVQDRVKQSPLSLGRTRVFQPSHITRRIVAQDGWFTAHNFFKKDQTFVPLNKNRRYSSTLMKLRVPAAAFAKLRFELDRCGINAAVLFPDLDGLCRTIEWQHSILPDEETE